MLSVAPLNGDNQLHSLIRVKRKNMGSLFSHLYKSIYCWSLFDNWEKKKKPNQITGSP